MFLRLMVLQKLKTTSQADTNTDFTTLNYNTILRLAIGKFCFFLSSSLAILFQLK